MHYNEVANYYIVAGPLLLYLALKRGSLWAANYFLSLVAVFILSSRTGLLAFLLTNAATAVVLGRTKMLIMLAPVVLIGAAVILGPVLYNLVTLGVSDPSDFSIALILNGRLDQLWLPLITEWWNDPNRFYFGAGEFGMLTSYQIPTGAIIVVSHPHNAFVEFFLNNGIFMLILLVLAVWLYLKWGWRTGRRLQSAIFWTIYLCTVSYLISCLTGRHFLPDVSNIIMFPIVAALINIVRLKIKYSNHTPSA